METVRCARLGVSALSSRLMPPSSYVSSVSILIELLHVCTTTEYAAKLVCPEALAVPRGRREGRRGQAMLSRAPYTRYAGVARGRGAAAR